MRSTPLAIFTGLVLLTACKGDDEPIDSDTAEEVVDDGVSPKLSELEAICRTHDEGGDNPYDLWSFSLSYDDPQGPNDVPRNTFQEDEAYKHGVSWGQDGQTVDTAFDIVVCDPDAATCTGSFQANLYSLPCTSADEWTFELFVVDVDGNKGSATVQGERGASVSG